MFSIQLQHSSLMAFTLRRPGVAAAAGCVLLILAKLAGGNYEIQQAGSALVAENAKRALLPAICCELGGSCVGKKAQDTQSRCST